MSDIPRRTLVSTLVLALLTAGAIVVTFLGLDRPWTRHELVLVVLLFGTVLLSEVFDVSFPQSVTFHVSVSAAFGLAAGLTVSPALGALAVSAAHLADGAYQRRQPIKTVVNSTVHGMSCLASGIAYLALSQADRSPLGSYRNMGAVVLAAAVYTLINSGALAFIVAPVVRMSAFEMWRANFSGFYVEMITLVTLGSLVPILVAESPVAIVLLIVPLFIGPRLAFKAFQKAQEESRIAMEGLADALERRDPYTHRHSIRVTDYVRAILGEMPHIPRQTSEATIAAARIHDLGKVGTRDTALQKPGALSFDERREIEQHAAIGAEIVGRLQVYQLSTSFVCHHHERWDGSGYPAGLRGETIPIGARIIAVADAFDAMTSDRVYRRAMTAETALGELRKDSGTHFDPQVVAAFERAIEKGSPLPNLHKSGAAIDATIAPLPEVTARA